MSYAPAIALALTAFTQALAAQQTWLVGPNGNFADLPPAVVAASAGDTILIESGYYSATTIDKGLTIVGLAFPVSVAQLLISGVPANETIVIQELGATFLPGSPSPVFRVDNCPGLVLLEGFSVEGINGVHAEIVNSDHVVLRNSNLIAFDQPHVVINSHIIADDSEFYFNPSFQSPSAGILNLVNSEATLTNCHLDSWFSSPAQYAFLLAQSTLRLIATTWNLPGSTTNVDIFAACTGPSLLLQPANPPLTAPPTMTGCITSAGAKLPSLSIDDLIPGSPTALRIYADANTTAFVFVGLPASTMTPTPLGPLALASPHDAFVLATAMPTQGVLTVTFPQIPSQIPPGTTFGLQAAVASPQSLRLSTTTMATVRH